MKGKAPLMVQKIPKWLRPACRLGRNKYTIALIVFLAWIIFFDSNDLITQAGYVTRLHDLRSQKSYLIEQIDSTNRKLHRLKSNPEMLKKFAREKYLMKGSGEDVFIIRQDNKKE